MVGIKDTELEQKEMAYIGRKEREMFAACLSQ